VSKPLGMFTLVALVVANTLGAGVFTTSGFAMSALGSPVYVLAAWLVGGLLALCGAASYGALSRLMPVSGGEYYFLSRAVHPLAGFIAGWISLWAGFTGAIAFAAISFEAYLLPAPLRDPLPPNVTATGVIVVTALAHGLRVRGGVLVQNLAVAAKLLLIGGFVLVVLLRSDVGAWDGVLAWRETPAPAFSPSAFALTLMWVSYSYSGFNASVYVASEVDDPRRRVPRAMVIATVAVMLIYLLLNAIFVFGPAPGVIAGREDVAALAADALAGETLAGAVRFIIAIALLTSVSAMMMAGPRVYARMAEDGVMPAVLRFGEEVPRTAIALQAALAIAVVWTAGLRELLTYLGFTLGLSAAASVASLFAVARRGGERLPGNPGAPLVFICMTLLFAVLAAVENPRELLAAGLTILFAVLVYGVYGRRHLRLSGGGGQAGDG